MISEVECLSIFGKPKMSLPAPGRQKILRN